MNYFEILLHTLLCVPYFRPIIDASDVNEEHKRAKRLLNFNNNQFPALANLTKEMYNMFLN